MDTPNRVEERSCLSCPTRSSEELSLFFFFFPRSRRSRSKTRRRRLFKQKSPLRGVHCRRFNSSLTFVSGKYHPPHPMARGCGPTGTLGRGFSFCFTVRSFPETKRNETPSTWRKIILVRDSVRWTSTPPPLFTRV